MLAYTSEHPVKTGQPQFFLNSNPEISGQITNSNLKSSLKFEYWSLDFLCLGGWREAHHRAIRYKSPMRASQAHMQSGAFRFYPCRT